MKPYLEYYSQWAKLRIISKMTLQDNEPGCYLYWVQRQKRFLWWKWWHTELSCNSLKIAKEVYYELMNQARDKKK